MDKALFWDFDGTLVKADSKWSVAFREGLVREGIDLPMERLRDGLRQTFSWYDPSRDYRNGVGETWWRVLLDKIAALGRGYGLSDQAAVRVADFVRREILNPARYTLYEDAVETLERCARQGWRSYLLSNNFPELEAIVEALGLSAHFSGMVVSAQVGYEKPRREIFRLAEELAGNPSRRVMIGDNPLADIAGGREAGMATILVHSTADCPADAVCAALGEIPPLLAEYEDKGAWL